LLPIGKSVPYITRSAPKNSRPQRIAAAGVERDHVAEVVGHELQIRVPLQQRSRKNSRSRPWAAAARPPGQLEAPLGTGRGRVAPLAPKNRDGGEIHGMGRGGRSPSSTAR
jgi:hypothetical protein